MSEKERINATVNKLVSATDPEEVKRAYRQWANNYDNDLDSFGYVAPQIGLRLFVDKVKDKQALIHDAGCGTGLVGALLGQLGYQNIHGSDFSNEMIEKAKATNCYSSFMSLDFGAPLALEDNSYDAAISIGVYTKRFNQHFLFEMIRILRPSGYFVFSCREQYFDEVISLVTEQLKDKTVDHVSVRHDDYMTAQNASAFYITMRKSNVRTGSA